MLLSTQFLFVLISTSFCYSLQVEVDTELDNLASNKQWADVERKLQTIRRAQEEQRRKLLTIDLRLNQMLGKMLHHTYVNDTLKLVESINKLQQSLEQRKENDKNLAEIRELLAQQATCSAQKQQEVAKVGKQSAKSDCYELDEQQRIDGVYKFLEPEFNELQRDFNERYCYFANDGGPAWTVIQRRTNDINNFLHFNRSWNEYRAGFGHLSKDFWFGNEFVQRIAYRDDYVLRIELQDHNGMEAWAEYAVFRMESESYNYQLVIGELSANSTANDALSSHNHFDFRVNEDGLACDCWWFDQCSMAEKEKASKSNLNGQHITWGNWHNEFTLDASRMMIRPRNNNKNKTLDPDEEY